jgi:hypothetical protein
MQVQGSTSVLSQANMKLRDRILAEREQRLIEAKEQKYLVKLYDEEFKILDRLDSDLKLQLDSALDVAGKLQIEMNDHEAYFKHLNQRLQACLKVERQNPTSVISRLCKSQKPPGILLDAGVAANNAPAGLMRFCPACAKIDKFCLSCGRGKPSVKKADPQQDDLIDLENRRNAMKAQLKYMEHKVQQLEIEVYISKMNVEIQMLQTSIKIEAWKKTGHVPTTVQISALDISSEAASQIISSEKSMKTVLVALNAEEGGAKEVEEKCWKGKE